MDLLALVLLTCAAIAGPRTLESPFPAGSKLELLWSEGEFTEGPALAPDGSIVFSDIGDRILRFDPSTRKVSVFREPSGRANGLIFDGSGRLIAAEGANKGGSRRVSITEKDGKVRTVADRFGGKKFNSPNDVAIDNRGRIYVSDPRYVGDEPRELDFEGVFRIDNDGTVTKLETSARKPNGLAISPDGTTLYVADAGPGRSVLLSLAIKPDGKLGPARVLKDFGDGRGIDGMTVTASGEIVAAAGGGILSGIYVYSPEGIPLDFLATPEPATNVEFGGPKKSTLYITAGKSLYRVETNMTGR